MKKVLFLMTAMLISLAAFAKSENETTVSFKVSPALSCGNCEQKVTSNLRFEKGVTAIEAKAPSDVVKVTYDSNKTDSDKIVNAFSKIGYTAVPCTDEAPACAPTECQNHTQQPAQCNKQSESCGGGCCGGNK